MTTEETIARISKIAESISWEEIKTPTFEDIKAGLERMGATDVRLDPDDASKVLYSYSPPSYITVTLNIER